MAVSTAAVVNPEVNELEKRRKEIADIITETKESLLDTESTASDRIMGRIYDIIKEVAEQEGYYIVLSKDDVLFSEEESIDLTEKVISRLNEE